MAEEIRIKGSYSNIADIPLDDADNLWVLYRAWYPMQEAKFSSPGVQVVLMELKDIYYSSNLSSKHRDVVLWHLIEEKTQQETAEEMKISPRSIKKLVDQALEQMVAYAATKAESRVYSLPLAG